MPGRVAIGDGTYGTVTHVAVDGGPWRAVTALVAQLGSVVEPPPPPPPPPEGIWPLMGTYPGSGVLPGNDDDHIRDLGGAPEVASNYYQVGNNSVNGGTYIGLVADQRPRLQRGTKVIVMFLSFKGYYGDSTGDANRSLTALKNGASDPDYTAISTITKNFADRLQALKDEFPDRRIVAVVEGELEAKAYKFLNGVTGQHINVASYVEAGQGLNEAYRIIRANAPGVEICLSFAATRTNEMRTIAQQITPGRCDIVGFDPYTNGNSTETMLKAFNDIVGWWRAEAVAKTLGNLPVCINECGVSAPTHTDAFMAQYIKPSATYTMRHTMRDVQGGPIEWALWFDSTADLDHEITDGQHPLAVQAYKDSFLIAPPTTAVPGVSSINTGMVNLGNPDPSTTLVPENSGIVVSRKNTASDRILWMHNDSGGVPHIYATDDVSPFTILGDYTVGGATNTDWEDIAWQKIAGVNYLVVGDIGSGAGASKTLYRFPEPSVTPQQSLATATIASGTVEVFTFTLPSFEAATDCESFFIDPITQDAFFFAKRTTATRPKDVPVYRIAASAFTPGGATNMPIAQVGTVRGNTASTNDGGITAADISTNGGLIMWCNYQEVWAVNRDIANGETVAQALARVPNGSAYRLIGTTWGGEALGIDTGTAPARFYGRAEGASATLKYGTLVY